MRVCGAARLHAHGFRRSISVRDPWLKSSPRPRSSRAPVREAPWPYHGAESIGVRYPGSLGSLSKICAINSFARPTPFSGSRTLGCVAVARWLCCGPPTQASAVLFHPLLGGDSRPWIIQPVCNDDVPLKLAGGRPHRDPRSRPPLRLLEWRWPAIGSGEAVIENLVQVNKQPYVFNSWA